MLLSGQRTTRSRPARAMADEDCRNSAGKLYLSRGAERYISIDRIQAHTYADALESLTSSFAVNPSYIFQIGELGSKLDVSAALSRSPRTSSVHRSSSRVKSVEVIQTWIDREIGLSLSV